MILWLLACTGTDVPGLSTQIGTEGDDFCGAEVVDVLDHTVPFDGLDFAGAVVRNASSESVFATLDHENEGPWTLRLELAPDGPLQVEREVSEDDVPNCDSARYVQAVSAELTVTQEQDTLIEASMLGWAFASIEDAVGIRLDGNDTGLDARGLQLTGFRQDGMWTGSLNDMPSGDLVGTWRDEEP